MTIYDGAGEGSGTGGYANADDILAIDARWSRVERWYPDLAQTDGIPSTLLRFGDSDALVEPDPSDFDSAIRHRALTSGGGIAACVVSEDDDIDALGAPGPTPAGPASLGSITAEAGGEVLIVFRIVTLDAANWLVLGLREGSGAFPFVDTYSYANVAAIGRTTLATATPVGDLEAITTDDGAVIERTPIVGAALVGAWLVASVSIPAGGASARLRLARLDDGTELADITHSTRVPSGARLCFGAVFNAGASGVSVPNAIDYGTIAVGYPA